MIHLVSKFAESVTSPAAVKEAALGFSFEPVGASLKMGVAPSIGQP